MRYWHPRMWSDDVLFVFHYIVDKPWEPQVGVDGFAGHLGRDVLAHRWWWDIDREWLSASTSSGKNEVVLTVVSGLVDTEKPLWMIVTLLQEHGKP